MDGWEYQFPFGMAYFQVRTVSFREGNIMAGQTYPIPAITFRVDDFPFPKGYVIVPWRYGSFTYTWKVKNGHMRGKWLGTYSRLMDLMI